MSSRPPVPASLAALVSTALAAGVLAAVPASATPDGENLVISEVFGGGGNSGAVLRHDFVELYNPTDAPIDLAGMSLQYRSGSSTGGLGGSFVLSGTVPPGAHWLVQGAQGSGGSQDLPQPDAVSTLAMGGSSGVVVLADTTETVPIPLGDVTGTPGVLDLVGYAAQRYETASGPGTTSTTSAARAAGGTDTDNNAADFTEGTPTPQSSGGTEPPPPPGPLELSIAEIQGTGPASGYDGQDVVTEGVVTAAYPTGGFNAFTIQTPGATPGAASHGLYVFGRIATSQVAVGDHVRVTGTVDEFNGLTELVADVDGVEHLGAPASVQPAAVAWPATDAGRESLESMLVAPIGPFTVTNNYVTNDFAEIGIAAGTEPLAQPTDVAPFGSAEAEAVADRNEAALVTLDDGASIDFLPFTVGGDNQDIPLPWLTDDPTIRVGEPVTFTNPVIVDYRFGLWRLQPTAQLTAGDQNGVLPATFGDTRTAAPAETGGDITVASFNVLNYFTTTGDELDGCSYYVDRDLDPVTVRGGCLARGAAEEEDLQRQQAKIVHAINGLGADVVSLEEIENSAYFGKQRDQAVADLVAALNADAGAGTWAFVRTPDEVPALDREDVIRTAFIYRPSRVLPIGPSVIHDAEVFDEARDPLGQVFRPRKGRDGDKFILIVNHFKSKGSPPPSGHPDGDKGQGNWNLLRTEQAESLVAFAEELKARFDVPKVYLDGDFNSYTFEDPMEVLYEAGYANLAVEHDAAPTYQFDGLVGSLDHALANEAALADTTGADVWNINSPEAIALEYSRHNYNATDFFDPSTPFRASDHDPIVFGIDVSK